MTSRKTSFSAPWSIIRRARGQAPSRTVSENWGRSGGFYGGPDVTTRGYESVLLYVRSGLGREEIILPVIDFILAVQKGVQKKWPLVPLSHGWGDELLHLGHGFEMGYMNDALGRERIAGKICRLAGDLVQPESNVIPSLYPKTGARSLIQGKIKATHRDLLVFVDFQGDLCFHYRLKHRFRASDHKRMVFNEVAKSTSESGWSFAPTRLPFSTPEGKSKS